MGKQQNLINYLVKRGHHPQLAVGLANNYYANSLNQYWHEKTVKDIQAFEKIGKEKTNE